MFDLTTDTMSTVAILRDTQTGASFLVPCASHDSLDTERLEETGLELAGWLQHGEQYNESWSDSFSDVDSCDTDELEDEDGRPIYQGPCFTECEREGCKKQIALMESGAPEFCTDHEEDA